MYIDIGALRVKPKTPDGAHHQLFSHHNQTSCIPWTWSW